MSKLKTVAGYLTGYSQTKNAARELKYSVSLPIYFIKGGYLWFKAIRDQAKADRELAETDDRLLWDKMCTDCIITNDSLRRAYKSLLFVNAILILGIAGVLGNLVANWDRGSLMIFANLAFLNMVCMMLFQNAYRVNMAYSQSAPPVIKFLRDVIRNPSLLVGKTLPADYQVRVRAK
ncbi:hypothetical protein [Pseudomonas sp. BF-R-01]|uniref:hypothetical protein n=1 Tax=Pseudomonas sp. BF-R-01 TaxID=2832365 RepID=UPI001CBFCAA1|nr:hypothetical protein [Pseudomonas sp. BF-R-01]